MPNKPIELKRKHLATIFVSMFLMMVAAICLSAFIVNSEIRHDKAIQQKQAIAAMTPVCQWLYASSDVYHENPPQTPAGVNQAKSVDNLIVSFQCERFVPRGH